MTERINDVKLCVSNDYIKLAQVCNEYMDEVNDADKIICDIKNKNIKANIFTFWILFQESNILCKYYMEYDPIAVIPIKSYEHWYNNQINAGARKAIRHSQKKNVIIKTMFFDETLARGIFNILSETPIRQNRIFKHYNKTFEEIKDEFSLDAEKCVFICAYYENELIGFIKLMCSKNIAVPYGMVSKIEHRDKSSQNALIAKAIDICVGKNIKYLVYGKWSAGSLNNFKINNGCMKYNIPRYYIPLTIFGRFLISFKLHKGVSNLMPSTIRKILNRLRYYYSIINLKSE